MKYLHLLILNCFLLASCAVHPPFPQTSSVPQPLMRPVPNSGGRWALAQDIEVKLPYAQKILTIKRGFLTDGTSIPQIFWSFTGVSPFDSDMIAASIVHDALYEAELLSRIDCDDEFAALLYFNSKRGAKWQGVFFTMVQDAGNIVWARHTKETIADARKYCSLAEERILTFSLNKVIQRVCFRRSN